MTVKVRVKRERLTSKSIVTWRDYNKGGNGYNSKIKSFKNVVLISK